MITERINTITRQTPIYPGKPSRGRKPSKTSSIQMYQKYKDKTPNKCSFSFQICLFHSPMCYTQVSVCLDFYLNKSAPTNLLGQLHLGRHKTYYTIFRRVLLTRLTMEVLPHDSMMTNIVVTSLRRNKTSPIGYISKIHLEYSSKLQFFNNHLFCQIYATTIFQNQFLFPNIFI